MTEEELRCVWKGHIVGMAAVGEEQREEMTGLGLPACTSNLLLLSHLSIISASSDLHGARLGRDSATIRAVEHLSSYLGELDTVRSTIKYRERAVVAFEVDTVTSRLCGPCVKR